jgi:transketolase
MVTRARSSHIGSCYSIVEILAVLYGGVLRVDPSRPKWSERDLFVLSKGHACAAHYAVLAESGFFPVSWLDTYYLNGSRLAGHSNHVGVPGVDASTGSLGHGLSLSAGMALAARLDDRPTRVFCLISDGECDEGSTWEAAMFAAQQHLDNLVVILDYNRIQSFGTTQEVMDLEPLTEKWGAFNWAVDTLDGHDFSALSRALAVLPAHRGRPTCLIAHTVKGKGISFMENQLAWHYQSPRQDEFEAALRELEAAT